MTLFRAAVIELVACWLVWLVPFLIRAKRNRGRAAQITVSKSLIGLALETAGMGAVLVYFPGTRPAGLILTAMVLAPVGPWLAWWSVRHLGRHWRLRAGLYGDHELVRSGPYRVVRHPVYSSVLAMFLATAFLLSTWQVWVPALAVVIAGTEIRVRMEERLLAERFGAHFGAYKASVRAAYVPFLR